MLIYFAGPREYMSEALALSQYCCTRPVIEKAEAEAFVLVWDGTDPEVKMLMGDLRDGRPRYVYWVG